METWNLFRVDDRGQDIRARLEILGLTIVEENDTYYFVQKPEGWRDVTAGDKNTWYYDQNNVKRINKYTSWSDSYTSFF